jgi:ribosomal protein S12 methylthiotransferase accessory factor
VFTRPRLKRFYLAEPAGDDAVVLLSETRQALLRGRLYALVVPLLDGVRSVDDVVAALDGRATAAEVLYTLDLLERRGHLAEGGAALPGDQEAFWEALGVDPRVAAERLSATAVALSSAGGAPADPLARALEPLGVRIDARGELRVIVTDDGLRADLAAVNRQALAEGRPWAMVKPAGAIAWIGPVFRPGVTGCWACLARRLHDHRTVESAIMMRRGTADPLPLPRASLPAGTAAAAEIAALEIAKWIAGAASERVEGRVLTLDTLRMELRDHALVRRPQCPACGAPASSAEPGPITLESRPKPPGGGHRAVPPERTLAAYERHVSPVTGVIAALQRPPWQDPGGVHIYDAGPNLALRTDDISIVRASFRSRSGGKGRTDVDARASALCEALERYSGVFQGDEPRRTARLADLGGAAVHPDTLLGYSAAQYEHRAAQGRRRTFHERVPEPFDPSVPIEWTPAWSLTRGERRWVPTAHCYYGYPCPPERRFCFADSNGCAAGNSIEEAVLQGFLELAERDAVSLWWYSRAARPGVDLESFDDPYLRTMEATYRALGRRLWVLDLTNDLGIPVFAALGGRVDREPGRGEEIVFGFGAHLDARAAVARAVTEANQFLASVHAAGVAEAEDDATGAWLREVTLATDPYLDADRRAAPRAARDYPDLASRDVAEDVRRCVAAAERAGVETLVVDQTRPDIGLPVVKVIAPGLRHFWRRLGPGRLYDVPPALGWVAAPLREDQMNPRTVFF